MRRSALLTVCVVAPALALAACVGSSASEDGGSAGADTSSADDSGTGGTETESGGTDTGTGGETETETETGEEPGSTVGGWVTDIEGAPIEALPITLCGEVCQVGTTDAEGYFEIPDVAPGVKVVEPALVPIGDGPGEELGTAVISWTRFFDLVTVVEGEDLLVEEPFVMLGIEGAVGPLVGEQTLDLLPNLQVSFDADAILDEGPLPVGATAVWLGATEVPEELWPVGVLGDWSVLAVWSLAIWDLEAPDAFAVSATLPDALAPDAEVAFLVADYTYGFVEGVFFEEPAELSPDGLVLSTPVGAGIDRATRWLAVTR